MPDIERLPPSNLEAEEAVLGCVMIDQDSVHEVPHLLGSHFFSSGNGVVFDTMRQMITDGISPDVVTLHEKLERAGLEFDIADLIGLTLAVPTSTGITRYAGIVSEMHERREMVRTAGVLANAAYSDSNTLLEARKTAAAALLEVTMVDSTSGDESSRKVASAALDRVFELQAAGGKMQGLGTGYDAVDDIIRGLQGGRLYLVGARPGVGKTAFATNVAERVALRGKRVMFFTLEMTTEQLMFRMAAQMSSCSYGDVSEGKLTPEELARVAKALGELSEMNITMVSSARTPAQMYSRIMREMAYGGVDLVIVDYIQLMSTDKRYGSRVLEVGALSRRLAEMTISLNIPIVALAQLSRKLESRENKRPTLTDLRDSGELEQDAAIVMFLFRQDYYEDDYDDDDDDIIPGVTELNVAKNRFGATGVVKIMFSAHCGRFDSIKGFTTVQL